MKKLLIIISMMATVASATNQAVMFNPDTGNMFVTGMGLTNAYSPIITNTINSISMTNIGVNIQFRSNLFYSVQNGTGMVDAASGSLPAAPAVGDMIRYDGTNWIKASAYEVRGTNIPCQYIGLYDWSATNFIHDSNWHTIELPSFVPQGVKWVDIRAVLKSTTANTEFDLYSDVSGPGSSMGMFGCVQGANITFPLNGSVGLIGTNRFLAYISNLTGTDDTTLRAWFIFKGWGY